MLLPETAPADDPAPLALRHLCAILPGTAARTNDADYVDLSELFFTRAANANGESRWGSIRLRRGRQGFEDPARFFFPSRYRVFRHLNRAGNPLLTIFPVLFHPAARRPG